MTQYNKPKILIEFMFVVVFISLIHPNSYSVCFCLLLLLFIRLPFLKCKFPHSLGHLFVFCVSCSCPNCHQTWHISFIVHMFMSDLSAWFSVLLHFQILECSCSACKKPEGKILPQFCHIEWFSKFQYHLVEDDNIISHHINGSTFIHFS